MASPSQPLPRKSYHGILDRLKQSVFEIDSDGLLRWLNPAAEQLLGATPEQYQQRPWAQLMQLSRADGRPLDNGSSVVDRTLTDGADRSIRKLRLSVAGPRSIIVSGDCFALKNDSGLIEGCVLVLTDVSDAHLSEQIYTWEATVLTLISSGADLGMVFNSITQGVESIQTQARASVLLVVDEDQRLECACAPNLPDQYGLSVAAERIGPNAGPSAVAAYSGKSIFVSDIEQDDRWANYRTLAQAYGFRSCWVIPVMDPFNQTVLATFNLYCIDPKTPTDADIAILKRASHLIAFALERSNIERERDESDARFRQLAEEIDEVFWLSNLNGKILYVSPSFERIWGFGSDSLYQSPWLWLDSVIKDDRQLLLNAMTKKGTSHFQVEYRIRRPDGNIIWIEHRAFPVLNEQGEVYRLAGIARDISGRKFQQEQQSSLLCALEQSNKELDHYASVVSHDLQAPLRKITYFSDRLLSQPTGLSQVQSDYLVRMNKAAVRMRELVQDLLIYSRLANQRSGPITEVDLHALAQRVLHDLDVSADERQPIVKLESLPIIKGYTLLWQQLLQNLLCNALKFQPPGQRPEIRLFCDYDAEQRLRLHCCDNGIGFDITQTPDILKPFVRLHGQHKYEGNGIGLAIVKKVADWHQLTIHIDSQPGKGSCFILTWPKVNMVTL